MWVAPAVSARADKHAALRERRRRFRRDVRLWQSLARRRTLVPVSERNRFWIRSARGRPLRRGLATVDDLPPCLRVGGALGHLAGLPHQVEDDSRGDGPSRSSICRLASVINGATSAGVKSLGVSNDRGRPIAMTAVGSTADLQCYRQQCRPMPHSGHCPEPVRMSQEDGEQSFEGGAKMKKSGTQPMPPVGDCYENRSHAA